MILFAMIFAPASPTTWGITGWLKKDPRDPMGKWEPFDLRLKQDLSWEHMGEDELREDSWHNENDWGAQSCCKGAPVVKQGLLEYPAFSSTIFPATTFHLVPRDHITPTPCDVLNYVFPQFDGLKATFNDSVTISVTSFLRSIPIFRDSNSNLIQS